ncbi:MAG: hypothetical protein E5299_00427 [Burkholderia gladioli]|nr:MAG: hypothetical protein E5299_00427 [Burkholderia gladioli]
MYRFKTLTGNCLWARHIDSQAAEVSVRVGVINRMADLARPQWRCCINRARSVDVYAQRSRGQPPIKSDSRVTA